MSAVKFVFEDSQVYQKVIVFVNKIYEVSSSFPQTENYKLTTRFTQAATAITFNIATKNSNIKPSFFEQSKTSLDSVNECLNCIAIAKNQNYISEEAAYNLRLDLEELSQMIVA